MLGIGASNKPILLIFILFKLSWSIIVEITSDEIPKVVRPLSTISTFFFLLFLILIFCPMSITLKSKTSLLTPYFDNFEAFRD